MNTTNNEKQLQAITELFVSKLESLEKTDSWDKPWIDKNLFFATNVRGTAYGGSNVLFLSLLSHMKGYENPIFLTFKQANELGVQIKSGEKAFPVFYNDKLILNDQGEKIKPEDFVTLDETNKKNCKVISYLKHYYVFNMDQTNMREQKPDLYQKLVTNRNETLLERQFSNKSLTSMIENKNWVCPIFIGLDGQNIKLETLLNAN